jgi:hypothetical protein
VNQNLPDKAQIYSRAVDIIHERGHHKGSLWGDDGSVCTLGAVFVALDEAGLTMPHSVRQLQHYIWPAVVVDYVQPLADEIKSQGLNVVNGYELIAPSSTVAFFSDSADADAAVHVLKATAERVSS